MSKYPSFTTKDSLHGLFEQGAGMLQDFWNVMDHPEFPFVTLTSTTNGFRNFPPYNIVENTTTGKVRIEMAVAGFTRDRLKVELEGNTLIIQGTPKKIETHDVVRHRGLTNAAFLRSFDLTVGTIIDSVELNDGILTVTVGTKKPEAKKRTSFDIK